MMGLMLTVEVLKIRNFLIMTYHILDSTLYKCMTQYCINVPTQYLIKTLTPESYTGLILHKQLTVYRIFNSIES
jgi:hypothetical protein